MKEQDKIKEFFQESFKNFEVQPDASIWSGIESSISSGASGTSGLSNISVAGKVAIGLAVASGIALSAYFVGQSNESKDKKTEETKVEHIISTKLNETKGSPLFADSAVVFEKASDELTVQEEDVEENKIVEDVQEVQAVEKAMVVEKYSDTLSVQQSSIPEYSEDGKNSDKSLIQATEVAERGNGTNSATSKPMLPTGNSNEIINPENSEQQNSKETVNNSAQSSGTTSMTPIVDEEESKEIHHVIPNIFTPNQDGVNDVFRIETEDATNMEVTILDKKGKIVFEWVGLYGFWDGNLPNGEAAEVDNYFYRVLLIKDSLKIPKTGWVRLER